MRSPHVVPSAAYEAVEGHGSNRRSLAVNCRAEMRLPGKPKRRSVGKVGKSLARKLDTSVIEPHPPLLTK